MSTHKKKIDRRSANVIEFVMYLFFGPVVQERIEKKKKRGEKNDSTGEREKGE